MDPRDATRNVERGTRSSSAAIRSAFPLPRSAFGFTLIEILVALAIAGIVVLMAHSLFATAGAAGRALREARTALDREVNARRWLAATFLSLDVGTGG